MNERRKNKHVINKMDIRYIWYTSMNEWMNEEKIKKKIVNGGGIYAI